MNEPMIVASAKDQGSRHSAASEVSTRAWLVLGWIGLAFLTVGGADFLLTWFPLQLGNREWEFATVTQTFNGLPILLLGIGLLTVAAEQVERRWWGLIAVSAAGLLAVWIVVGFVIWALNVQLALATVPAELAPGIRKAIVKTFLQSLTYPAVMLYLVRRAWLQRPKAVDEIG